MSTETKMIDGMPVEPANTFEVTNGLINIEGPYEDGLYGPSIGVEVFHLEDIHSGKMGFDTVFELTLEEAARVRDWLVERLKADEEGA